MVKKLALFLAYAIFFIASLLFFLPKEELYYLAEKHLQKQGVVFFDETLNDEGFSLHLQNLGIAFKGVHGATAEDVRVKPFLLYNALSVKELKLAAALRSFLPLEVEEITVLYTPLSPLELQATARGAFGTIEGRYNIVTNEVHAKLNASDEMQKNYAHTLRYFKKEQNGEYAYAKKL